ncbi:GTP-binding protein Rhes [Corythoichthys intestinalis]|uniref:GTP-binding protein Rhes n=1 Tax=Corythoichthys intestinalis TaxID=161448 RepID=UPI0025A5B971|nr:GTP-binding protein Rhes [Corythoichthys intestinalis]XP_061792035.1 GTP-binding protein Rhes-like [Nerophis lumbriciformis]
MEFGSLFTGAQSSTIPYEYSSCCSSSDGHQRTSREVHSSKVVLAYKNASQNLNSSGIKIGLGILKVATSQWRHDKTTHASAATKQPTNCDNECKRTPLDQLAALVLHCQARRRQIGQEPRQEMLFSTKPKNCKRIVVLGAPRVGKTSILRRYLRDGFVEEYQPTSEDFVRKLFRIRGETYQIDVLDASRERDFPAKRRLSILTGDIFLLVFSLDDRSSFEEVCALRQEILAAKSKLTKSSHHSAQQELALVVCANKVDLTESERDVSQAEVLQALGDNCAYFETSAKDSTNLEKVFEALAKRGGLPAETGPSQHRKVSFHSYQAMRAGRVGVHSMGHDDACGVLYPLARRPSFSADLRQVIGPQNAPKAGKTKERCQIQ